MNSDRSLAAVLEHTHNKVGVHQTYILVSISYSPAGDRKPLWDIPEGVVVDPRDVMHENLAEFYLQAVVASKMSRCTPFYRLHGFGNCKISNVNVLYVRCHFLGCFVRTNPPYE